MSSENLLDNPKLRGNASRRTGPYPLGQTPDEVIFGIGRQLVHRIAIGQADISGDDFGAIFAESIGGEHRASPLGIADVVANGCAWSIKTVKEKKPFTKRVARLISGRNSPIYSVGIENPRANVEATGHAVVSVWNARVDQSLDQFNDLRVVIMIRNLNAREFLIFEEEVLRYNPADFEWAFNKNRNLVGRDGITGRHQFTWQPHGSQFTIHRPVPRSAKKFSITQNIPVIPVDTILARIRYQQDWITIHGQG